MHRITEKCMLRLLTDDQKEIYFEIGQQLTMVILPLECNGNLSIKEVSTKVLYGHVMIKRSLRYKSNGRCVHVPIALCVGQRLIVIADQNRWQCVVKNCC